MEKQYWFLMEDQLLGPYSAKEMMEFELLDNTPVTDNIADDDSWKTAEYFNFNASEGDVRNSTKKGGTRMSYTLKMNDGVYQFYFKQGEKQRGPRTAKQMQKLNLDSVTQVTTPSLNGMWFSADNFDFTMLALQEDEVRAIRRRLALRNMGTGVIWLLSGLLVTVVSFAADFGGGGVIAIGAILWGVFRILAGLFGDDGLTDEERARIFQFVDSDESDSDETADIEDMVLPSEELIELYAELELTPDATDNDVRNAYRQMAKRYHPDLKTNLSEENKKMAAEKFRNIQDAFELIKRLRNMK